jgi:hypothetical protein
MMPETVPESPTPFLSDAGNFRPLYRFLFNGSYYIHLKKKVGLIIFIHYELTRKHI